MEWLSNNLGIGMYIVLVVAIVALFILVLKGNQVRYNKKDGFSVGSGSKKKRNPHSACGHVKDVIQVFRNRDDLRAQLNKIETYKMPRDIMRIAEKSLDEAKIYLTSHYTKLLKEKDLDSIHQAKVLKLYDTMLCSLDTLVLDECRRMMHENSWAVKERIGEWNTYAQRNIESMIQKYSNRLDDMYVIENPSREELYNYKRSEVVSVMSDKLRKSFEEMLKIHKHWLNEIEALKSQMEIEMGALLGELE